MQIAACGSPRYCIAIRYEHIQSSLIANQAAVCTITATALTAGSQVNCSSTLSAVRLFANIRQAADNFQDSSHCVAYNCWLKINERIDYQLLSLTYKVLTTTQPSYLHNLTSLQPPRYTRTSSVVTLARPPASSSLKITNRSFRHASPHLWNKLPVSLRQPCLNQVPDWLSRVSSRVVSFAKPHQPDSND